MAAEKGCVRTGSQIGIMISEVSNPNLIRIFKQAGMDYLIIDDEHGGFDFSQLSAMIAVATGIQMKTIVRVPGVDRNYILKALDMGADGILVPMVNTEEDAKKIVEFSKYVPVGKRGVSTTRAHTEYTPQNLKEYFKKANDKVFSYIQIETREAVANAGKIAAVEGIDGIFIGPNDLATDLGKPGEVTAPEVLDTIAEVAKKTKNAGKPLGVITGKQDLILACRELGFSIFSIGSETDLLLNGAKSRVKQYQEIL